MSTSSRVNVLTGTEAQTQAPLMIAVIYFYKYNKKKFFKRPSLADATDENRPHSFHEGMR